MEIPVQKEEPSLDLWKNNMASWIGDAAKQHVIGRRCNRRKLCGAVGDRSRNPSL
jgi:hypothetical protein